MARCTTRSTEDNGKPRSQVARHFTKRAKGGSGSPKGQDVGKKKTIRKKKSAKAVKKKGKKAKTNSTGDVSLVFESLSEVEPEEITWIWDKRIVAGKVNIIYGDPGVGKTYLLLYILACVSKGQDFCDSSSCEAGEALVVTAEDGISDTIRPRLDQLGADVAKIHYLSIVRQGDDEVFLDLSKHLPAFEATLRQNPNIKVVMLDPLAATLGKTDSHRNSEVRAVLGRLAKMAEKLGVTIIAIDHLAKGQGKAIYRGIGSIAFTAAARAVWQVVKDPDDEARRLFLPVKCNLAKAEGLAFRVTDKGVVWDKGSVTITPDQVAAAEAMASTDDSEPTAREEAKRWILGLLKNGPKPSREIAEQARVDKLCWRTVKYAKRELGVRSEFDGNAWSWLPPAPKLKKSGRPQMGSTPRRAKHKKARPKKVKV